jgi:type I site-specific restriction-modification system, R (restriction) subunit
MQGYTGVYNDIYEEIREMRKAREEGTDEGDGEDRTDEVDLFANVHFQTELVKQQEIGVSYILALIEAAHDSNGDATEDIERAVNSSSELRASADIITDFSKEYRNTPNPGDVYERFHRYVTERRVEEENEIVRDENLDPEETQRVVNRALREGRRTIPGKLTSLIKVKMPLFGGDSSSEGAVSKTKRVKQRLEKHLGRFMSLLGGR